MVRTLPDTRPYPTDPVKNELPLHAGHIARNDSGAQVKLAKESLRSSIYGMLQQNHFLGLSVAMSMAPDALSYRALLDALADTVSAKTETEVQWFALPVIVVVGNNPTRHPAHTDSSAELSACLATYPHTRALAQATWLPHLVSDDQLAALDAGQWFAAKQSNQAAAECAQRFAVPEISVEAGQSVKVLYALGYGPHTLADSMGINLKEAALPLMQVWQQHLTVPGATLFANPLTAAAPPLALVEGSHTRLRMALDVFSANAIRAIRLQSPRVGVVMAAQEGGKQANGFNATDSQFELQPQVFIWPLSSAERIEIIQQDFLDLMAECQVENIRLLTQAVPEHTELPNYAQALKLEGFNPLFADQPSEQA